MKFSTEMLTCFRRKRGSRIYGKKEERDCETKTGLRSFAPDGPEKQGWLDSNEMGINLSGRRKDVRLTCGESSLDFS